MKKTKIIRRFIKRSTFSVLAIGLLTSCGGAPGEWEETSELETFAEPTNFDSDTVKGAAWNQATSVEELQEAHDAHKADEFNKVVKFLKIDEKSLINFAKKIQKIDLKVIDSIGLLEILKGSTDAPFCQMACTDDGSFCIYIHCKE